MSAWLAYLVHFLGTAAAVFFISWRRRRGLGDRLSAAEGTAAAVIAGLLLFLTSGPLFIDFIKATRARS